MNNIEWEKCILEDLEKYKTIHFRKMKLVINYIHISQSNQVRVQPKNFAMGKIIVKNSTWTRGTFFGDFSIGYSIFAE